MTAGSLPRLSVVVPVHDGEAHLSASLAAILASDLPRTDFELIVVDDASIDESPVTAARFADTVVRLTGQPRGPAYARNRGVEIARGEIVLCLDSDVRVHSDTLRRVLETLDAHPEAAAVYGIYDDRPIDGRLVTQYWTLLHRYAGVRNAGESETFGAACGAVRRAVLLEVGLFNEWHFVAPSLEDVELGRRLRAAGHRILLSLEVQATHLKRWSLGSVIADAWNRGVLLTRVLGYSRTVPSMRSDALHTLAGGGTLFAAGAAIVVLTAFEASGRGNLLALIAGVVLFVLANARMHRYMLHKRSVAFALAVVPLHMLAVIVGSVALLWGWTLRHLVGTPNPDAVTQAYAEVGVQMWPPVPKRR